MSFHPAQFSRAILSLACMASATAFSACGKPLDYLSALDSLLREGGNPAPVTPLTLSGVSPGAAASAKPITVTLTGTGILAGATVKIGGQTCQSPLVTSSTILTCETPSGLLGTKDIVVTNPDGATATLDSSFTFTKRIFITTATFQGNLGGFAGADGLCQTAANTAGLGGTWITWLSNSTTDAIDRLADASPWTLVDNVTTVFPTLASITASGPSVAITMTETGAAVDASGVWTNTWTNGRAYHPTDNCDDWTIGNGLASSNWGGPWVVPASGAQNWTSGYGGSCNNFNHLYCFEQ